MRMQPTGSPRCVGCRMDHAQNEDEQKICANLVLYCIRNAHTAGTDVSVTLAAHTFHTSNNSHHHNGIRGENMKHTIRILCG